MPGIILSWLEAFTLAEGSYWLKAHKTLEIKCLSQDNAQQS